MPTFRFKLYRTEVREAEMEVTADTFQSAAYKASTYEDGKVPRGTMMRKAFIQDEAPSITVEVISGRELR